MPSLTSDENQIRRTGIRGLQVLDEFARERIDSSKRPEALERIHRRAQHLEVAVCFGPEAFAEQLQRGQERLAASSNRWVAA